MPEYTIPSTEVIRTVLDDVIIPTLERLAKEVGGQLVLGVEHWKDDHRKKEKTLVVGKADLIIKGTMRMRFREAYGSRYLTFCEVMFERGQDTGSYSGCSVKADYRVGEKAKRTAWTVRHNVRHWTGWI